MCCSQKASGVQLGVSKEFGAPKVQRGVGNDGESDVDGVRDFGGGSPVAYDETKGDDLE